MPENQTPPTTPPAEPPAQTEADEWTGAEADFALEKGVTTEKKEEPKKEEENKDADKDRTTGDKSEDPAKSGEEKPASEEGDKRSDKDEEDKKDPKDGDADKEEKPPVAPSDPAVRDARATQREILEDQKAVREDIRKEMFSDAQKELTDADGDPIRTIEDVQKLMNPNTKKPFSEEEAAMWLLQAQQHLNKQVEQTERQIEEIADVNLALKDQSENVQDKWGELLKSMPKLRAELWAEYETTLTKDEKSGIITKAPVNLERFYDTALRGYAKSAELIEKQLETEEKAKKTVERVQTHSDRSDIYSGGKGDTTDPEDKEWQEAAKNVYER